MRALLAVAGLSLAATLALAETGPAEPAPKGPRIAVEPNAFDFGKALPQKTLSREFSIRNFGTEDLVIDGVTTSCGCTAALLDPARKVVKPGGSAPLRVTLNTLQATGRISKSVLVRSNDPGHAVLEIKIQATVVAETK